MCGTHETSRPGAAPEPRASDVRRRAVVPWSDAGPIALVRCAMLRGGQEPQRRYVRQTEFGLWRHLMEKRHRVVVVAQRASHWLSDRVAPGEPDFEPETCEPLVRLCCQVRGPGGLPMPLERYLPPEELEPAQSALLSHYEGRLEGNRLVLIPGYFMPSPGGARPGH